MSGDGGAARTKEGSKRRNVWDAENALVLLEGGVVVRRSQEGGSYMSRESMNRVWTVSGRQRDPPFKSFNQGKTGSNFPFRKIKEMCP